MGLVNGWVWWLAAAGGLAIPMVMTAMPAFGMFASGAVAAPAPAGLGLAFVPQVVIFLVVSVALVSVIRVLAARHRTTRPEHRTNVDALKGRSALVLERVDRGGGRVKLGGGLWSARFFDATLVFEPGQEVDVVEIEG